MSNQSLDHWQQILQDIEDRKRHRLTGAEYKAVVDAIDRARSAEMRQVVVDIVVRLAHHDGVGSSPPFADPLLRRIYQVECEPAAPRPGDPRARDRVVAGELVFRSREFGHEAESNIVADQADRGGRGREVTAQRFDIWHRSNGVVDHFDLHQVKSTTHVSYATGASSASKDISDQRVGSFMHLGEAIDHVRERLGDKTSARILEATPHTSDRRRPSAPRPR